MRRNWISTDRLWCMFFVLAVSRVTGFNSKTIDQIKVPIPTKESLPQVAEELKAASYLEDNDGIEKNFEGQRNNYKRTARKLGADNLDQNSELQDYQGVVGRPGVDFPILASIPHTDFSCKKAKKPGYYADPETDCQVFHICDNGRKVSFLCPNGTVFRQSHLICDWWFRVDCERSIELYEESAEQLASDQRIFKQRAEALAKAMLKVQTTTDINDRVITERSFGPSTTIFNSESRLPERARYFGSYSKDESQVPAETGSFAKNHFQTNLNNYYQQSKTPVKNWNQGDNFQAGNYQSQPSTTIQTPWNQGVNNNNYQSGSGTYQTQPTSTVQPPNTQGVNNFQSGYQPQYTSAHPSTTIQTPWNQGVNNNNYQSGTYQSQSTSTIQPPNTQGVNNFQSGYQPQYTNAQPIPNQGVTSSQVAYQSQPTSAMPQANWNQGSNNYQSQNHQPTFTSTVTNSNRNNHGNNGFGTESYQSSYTPSIIQSNWNHGDSYQSTRFQSPPTTEAIQNNWNNQNYNNFQTENFQFSPSTPTPSSLSWNNQITNDFKTVNQPKQVISIVPQTDRNQAVNNIQSNNYQSQAATTLQPDWNQESDTIQPSIYNSEPPYQQSTTIFPVENEQTNPPKESQILAESASFIGNQNLPQFNFQPENVYTQTPQTTPLPTTYPVTNSYSNEYSPNGAFSFVNYQRSPNYSSLDKDSPTQAPPTTVFDYAAINNSTLPPSGETLIPNMINSLQTLTDNNILDDLDGQGPSQTNLEDELNTVALYFNNIKNPHVTTFASDLQSRSYTNGLSSVSIATVETTTAAAVENLDISAVLTQNTKEAYDKLFKNNTNTESTTPMKLPETNVTTPSSTSPANLGFAQGLNLNRSSAELRELAAVFTRALTAYLDNPENFRKILAEVRPTEPPSVRTSVTEEQEVLDFSDDSKNHRNQPTVPSTTNSNLASDVNGMTQHINADLSTIVPQYTTSPLIDITSKYTARPNDGLQEYAPPADSEQLQTAGSQSFYSSRDNSIETVRTPKPVSPTLTWTVSPIIDTEQDIKTTTLPPVYFTTPAENLETTVIVQRAKEMFSHLNESDAEVLMNAMKNGQANDAVKRLVLLLVNDPNKENTPQQTRDHIVRALLENNTGTEETVYPLSPETNSATPETYSSSPKIDVSSPGSEFTSPGSDVSPAAVIPFGQRLRDDGSPVSDGQPKRKGSRRRVAVHRTRSVTTTASPAAVSGAEGPNAGLDSDSDARAVELLKSLYSIASKWS